MKPPPPHHTHKDSKTHTDECAREKHRGMNSERVFFLRKKKDTSSEPKPRLSPFAQTEKDDSRTSPASQLEKVSPQSHIHTFSQREHTHTQCEFCTREFPSEKCSVFFSSSRTVLAQNYTLSCRSFSVKGGVAWVGLSISALISWYMCHSNIAKGSPTSFVFMLCE